MFNDFFENIQNEIQYNVDFFNLCTKISNLLSEIDAENTAIQAGQKTVYDAMPQLLTDLLSNVNLALSTFLTIFLTTEQQTAYAAWTFTLDETLNISLISFYNSLQKLKLLSSGSLGIIKATLKSNTIRFYANADDYTLTTDQFENDNETNNRIQNNNSFEYYTVQDGDTARIVALRILKDSEKYISILQINNISESSFIDGTLIGTKIKIPVDYAGSVRNENNLIYEASDDNILNYLHGKDLCVDVNKKLLLNGNGDFLEKGGIDNTYDAVLNRIDNNKGSLNVFSPSWGVTPIGDGNCPLMVKIDRYLTDLTAQIQSDPRVTTVKLNMESIRIEGEALYVNGTVKFLGSDEGRGFEVNI